MDDPYRKELQAATVAVRRAADRYVRAGNADIGEKPNPVGSYDIVTPSDTDAQESIMSEILSAFPGDGFCCEEGGNGSPESDRVWVVDPIDGTLSYERGMPLYGTQLALLVGSQPVLSVIYLPVFGEMYTATEASGAELNGMPLGGAPSRDLRKCVVSTGDFSRRKQEWRDIQYGLMGAMRDELARIRMLGAACCDFAFFAAGRTDIHIRFVNNPWDFMPGLFLARKAGAYVDEELLESKSFLLLTQSEEEAGQFRERVLSKVVL